MQFDVGDGQPIDQSCCFHDLTVTFTRQTEHQVHPDFHTGFTMHSFDGIQGTGRAMPTLQKEQLRIRESLGFSRFCFWSKIPGGVSEWLMVTVLKTVVG